MPIWRMATNPEFKFAEYSLHQEALIDALAAEAHDLLKRGPKAKSPPESKRMRVLFLGDSWVPMLLAAEQLGRFRCIQEIVGVSDASDQFESFQVGAEQMQHFQAPARAVADKRFKIGSLFAGRWDKALAADEGFDVVLLTLPGGGIGNSDCLNDLSRRLRGLFGRAFRSGRRGILWITQVYQKGKKVDVDVLQNVTRQLLVANGFGSPQTMHWQRCNLGERLQKGDPSVFVQPSELLHFTAPSLASPRGTQRWVTSGFRILGQPNDVPWSGSLLLQTR